MKITVTAANLSQNLCGLELDGAIRSPQYSLIAEVTLGALVALGIRAARVAAAVQAAVHDVNGLDGCASHPATKAAWGVLDAIVAKIIAQVEPEHYHSGIDNRGSSWQSSGTEGKQPSKGVYRSRDPSWFLVGVRANDNNHHLHFARKAKLEEVPELIGEWEEAARAAGHMSPAEALALALERRAARLA